MTTTQRKYSIEFFGWCKTSTHDKVWGYVAFDNDDRTERTLYNFWGARGKKYQFKKFDGFYDHNVLRNKARSKMYPSGNKDPYRDIDIDDIQMICPGFFEEFEEQLFMAKLCNSFHGVKEID